MLSIRVTNFNAGGENLQFLSQSGASVGADGKLSWFKNPVNVAIVCIALVLYTCFFTSTLNFLKPFLNNSMGRLVLACVVAYVAVKSPIMAVLLIAAILLTLYNSEDESDVVDDVVEVPEPIESVGVASTLSAVPVGNSISETAAATLPAISSV